MSRLRIILPLCLIGSAATAEQTMVDLKTAAEAIEAQLALANNLAGSLHSYGHSTWVVEDGVVDPALIDQTMVNAYNDAITNVLSTSYLTAADVLLDQHNTAINNLHTAIDNLVVATSVLATVSAVADMAASADTTQEQLQVQAALATTDMTITQAEVSDFNNALVSVNTYATQAGAFLAAANNTSITGAIDSFASANNATVAAYTAISYTQNIDQMIIMWEGNLSMAFQGYNTDNTISAETIYSQAGYYGGS